VIFNGASAKDLRLHLLNETDLKALPIFTNRGIFEGVDNRFVFGIPVSRVRVRQMRCTAGIGTVT